MSCDRHDENSAVDAVVPDAAALQRQYRGSCHRVDALGVQVTFTVVRELFVVLWVHPIVRRRSASSRHCPHDTLCLRVANRLVHETFLRSSLPVSRQIQPLCADAGHCFILEELDSATKKVGARWERIVYTARPPCVHRLVAVGERFARVNWQRAGARGALEVASARQTVAQKERGRRRNVVQSTDVYPMDPGEAVVPDSTTCVDAGFELALRPLSSSDETPRCVECSAQNLTLQRLRPDSTYSIAVRAICGATGLYGPWGRQRCFHTFSPPSMSVVATDHCSIEVRWKPPTLHPCCVEATKDDILDSVVAASDLLGSLQCKLHLASAVRKGAGNEKTPRIDTQDTTNVTAKEEKDRTRRVEDVTAISSLRYTFADLPKGSSFVLKLVVTSVQQDYGSSVVNLKANTSKRQKRAPTAHNKAAGFLDQLAMQSVFLTQSVSSARGKSVTSLSESKKASITSHDLEASCVSDNGAKPETPHVSPSAKGSPRGGGPGPPPDTAPPEAEGTASDAVPTLPAVGAGVAAVQEETAKAVSDVAPSEAADGTVADSGGGGVDSGGDVAAADADAAVPAPAAPEGTAEDALSNSSEVSAVTPPPSSSSSEEDETFNPVTEVNFISSTDTSITFGWKGGIMGAADVRYRSKVFALAPGMALLPHGFFTESANKRYTEKEVAKFPKPKPGQDVDDKKRTFESTFLAPIKNESEIPELQPSSRYGVKMCAFDVASDKWLPWTEPVVMQTNKITQLSVLSLSHNAIKLKGSIPADVRTEMKLTMSAGDAFQHLQSFFKPLQELVVEDLSGMEKERSGTKNTIVFQDKQYVPKISKEKI